MWPYSLWVVGAAAKMASVVTLIIEKNMKKIFKKKIISNLLTLIFSRYETGNTGIFFYALISPCLTLQMQFLTCERESHKSLPRS